MDRHISYIVENEFDGVTVKEYLKNNNYSSQIISNLKHIEDGIMHCGKRAYVTENVHCGDSIEINIYETESSEKIPPVKMELDIIYEDDDLVIVNKPSDMPVHPSLNNYENTLANGLAWYYESKGEKFVFRCMNRLDRNTTGAVLVAKNAISGGMLSQMIRERTIEKEYIAIANGRLEEEEFVIDAPIGRVDGSTIERKIDFEKGERAITHVKVNRYIDKCNMTYVSCSLETGRTHQIRVHMSYIGHPLEGDGLYNPKYEGNEYRAGEKRQMLHCSKLQFIHPITRKMIIAQAGIPEDMEVFLAM